MTTLSLAGTVAVVTGADTEPGASIACELARRGARVGAQYLVSFASAVRLVREIEQIGGRAVAIKADLTDPAQVELLCLKVGGTLGGIDTLVLTEPAAEADPSDGPGAAASRALSCLLPLYAALPRMVARGGGSLAYVPQPDGAPDTAPPLDQVLVRATVEGAMARLAAHFGDAGIRVLHGADLAELTGATTLAVADGAFAR